MVIDGFITVKEEIGQGAFCKVRKAIGVYETGEVVNYALKIYKKSELRHIVPSPDPTSLQVMRQIDLVRKELSLWGRLDHKNIVKIFRLYEDEKEDKMYVWMQYADLG